MAVSFIGFGSNIGDREKYIARALSLLAANNEIKILKLSALYESQPIGIVDQDDFLNGVVSVSTTMSPEGLLNFCMQVEGHLGRKRDVRWGPRTIDLDILLFDDIVMNTDELTIPHRELRNRRFVLQPLAEIAADVIVPDCKKSVRQLLRETDDKSRVQLSGRLNYC